MVALRTIASSLFAAVLLTTAASIASSTISSPAFALEPEEKLDDPALEVRAREISKGLRCVVCQNQSIDDSDAAIAADMRKLVRERLVAGDSNAEVRDRMVEYYGEYVLLRPEFSLSNAALWLAPFVMLMIGGAWYLRRTGRAGSAMEGGAEEAAQAICEMSTSDAPRPLSAEEDERVKRLLRE